jgi:hypothetical protein
MERTNFFFRILKGSEREISVIKAWRNDMILRISCINGGMTTSHFSTNVDATCHITIWVMHKVAAT